MTDDCSLISMIYDNLCVNDNLTNFLPHISFRYFGYSEVQSRDFKCVDRTKCEYQLRVHVKAPTELRLVILRKKPDMAHLIPAQRPSSQAALTQGGGNNPNAKVPTVNFSTKPPAPQGAAAVQQAKFAQQPPGSPPKSAPPPTSPPQPAVGSKDSALGPPLKRTNPVTIS